MLKIISALMLSFLVCLQSGALTKEAAKLVDYETHGNAVASRSSVMVKLPHVEIPINLVGIDFADRLDPEIRKSLVFSDSAGRVFVRWILNPEDTKWSQELLTYFKDKGVKLEIKHYFQGYQTASRSYIAEDPNSKISFSVKSSTNKTGGHWSDKKQPVGDALDGRRVSDFIYQQSLKKPFENFYILDEPAVLQVAKIDQAVVIRDIGILKSNKNDKFLLPGFSALNEKVGREIALKNGSHDPLAFWTEHYIKIAGLALGEFAARTGLQLDSPHSQNFLVELDANYKPTGKLVIRDMSDMYIYAPTANALLGKNHAMIKNFSDKSNIVQILKANFGPLHGNLFPNWVNQNQYSTWKNDFYKSFESAFKKTSGFELTTVPAPKIQSGNYFMTSYKLDHQDNFKPFFEMMKSDGFVDNHQGKMLCRFIFK